MMPPKIVRAFRAPPRASGSPDFLSNKLPSLRLRTSGMQRLRLRHCGLPAEDKIHHTITWAWVTQGQFQRYLGGVMIDWGNRRCWWDKFIESTRNIYWEYLSATKALKPVHWTSLFQFINTQHNDQTLFNGDLIPPPFLCWAARVNKLWNDSTSSLGIIIYLAFKIFSFKTEHNYFNESIFTWRSSTSNQV